MAIGTGIDLEAAAPALVQQAVGALPFGLLVAAADCSLISANPAAEQILIEAGAGGYAGVRCCDVLGCRRAPGLNDRCISELAAESTQPLPEVRLDLPVGQPRIAVWMSASRITADGSRLVIHLRRGEVGDRRRRTSRPLVGGSRMRVNGLGQTRVSVGGVDLGGDWLLQRPGELLRYMVCQRRRPVHVDEIVEALSPDAPADTGRNRTRHLIHVLRHRLEPGRARRTRSSFLSSVGSTYLLDPGVELDVEEFEEHVAVGLRGPSQTPTERLAAAAALEHALRLYKGDLFSDDPYSPWIQHERERLRGLAYDSLVWLVQHFRDRGELDIVGRYLERGVALWPLDTKVHRALIDLHLEQGRSDAALRRYEILTARMRRELGVAPDFSLAGLRSD